MNMAKPIVSHLTRGAWIEINLWSEMTSKIALSHLTRGAWIEIIRIVLLQISYESHLTRGAWIEMFSVYSSSRYLYVAPHTRCVD